MEAATQEGALPVEEAVAPRSGFEIDGKFYAIPTLDTVNLDEERILYVYADTVLQDFMPAHPEASEEEQNAATLQQLRVIRNPDFKRALAHIAYKRQHPGVNDADIQVAIGKANALAVDIAMLRGDDDPSSSSQTSSSNESGESEPSSSTTSGSDTEDTSSGPVVIPSRTGTTESDTSSPLLAQAIGA